MIKNHQQNMIIICARQFAGPKLESIIRAGSQQDAGRTRSTHLGWSDEETGYEQRKFTTSGCTSASCTVQQKFCYRPVHSIRTASSSIERMVNGIRLLYRQKKSISICRPPSRFPTCSPYWPTYLKRLIGCWSVLSWLRSGFLLLAVSN